MSTAQGLQRTLGPPSLLIRYKTTEKFALKPECFEDAGKIIVLLKLLGKYQEEGRRILIFSQVSPIPLMTFHDVF